MILPSHGSGAHCLTSSFCPLILLHVQTKLMSPTVTQLSTFSAATLTAYLEASATQPNPTLQKPFAPFSGNKRHRLHSGNRYFLKKSNSYNVRIIVSEAAMLFCSRTAGFESSSSYMMPGTLTFKSLHHFPPKKIFFASKALLFVVVLFCCCSVVKF